MRVVHVEVLMLVTRHVRDEDSDQKAYQDVSDELVEKFGSRLLLSHCREPEDTEEQEP